MCRHTAMGIITAWICVFILTAYRVRMAKLFRETPPVELVSTILCELGFTGITDSKLFSIEDISTEKLESWAPLLEPYYLPCKAKRYFNDLNERRIITILRHLLPAHGFRIQAYERLNQGKKRMVYQIHPATPRLLAQGEEICVLFL